MHYQRKVHNAYFICSNLCVLLFLNFAAFSTISDSLKNASSAVVFSLVGMFCLSTLVVVPFFHTLPEKPIDIESKAIVANSLNVLDTNRSLVRHQDERRSKMNSVIPVADMRNNSLQKPTLFLGQGHIENISNDGLDEFQKLERRRAMMNNYTTENNQSEALNKQIVDNTPRRH